MNKYVVTNPVTLRSGVVRLTKEQASKRAHALEPAGKDCYHILGQIQFKDGEEIGYEGDLPKSMADNLTTKEAAEAAAKKAAAEAEKAASKSAKEAEKAAAKQAEEAAKARAKLESEAESEWKANADLREQHGNDFNAYRAAVLEQLG